MAAPERSKVALCDGNVSGEINPIVFSFVVPKGQAERANRRPRAGMSHDVLAQEGRTHAQGTIF